MIEVTHKDCSVWFLFAQWLCLFNVLNYSYKKIVGYDTLQWLKFGSANAITDRLTKEGAGRSDLLIKIASS